MMGGSDSGGESGRRLPRRHSPRRTTPHAARAHFHVRTRRLVVELTNGSAFSLPGENIPGLESATDDELAQVEVGAAGIWLRWEALDADLSVAGLARLVQ